MLASVIVIAVLTLVPSHGFIVVDMAAQIRKMAQASRILNAINQTLDYSENELGTGHRNIANMILLRGHLDRLVMDLNSSEVDESFKSKLQSIAHRASLETQRLLPINNLTNEAGKIARLAHLIFNDKTPFPPASKSRDRQEDNATAMEISPDLFIEVLNGVAMSIEGLVDGCTIVPTVSSLLTLNSARTDVQEIISLYLALATRLNCTANMTIALENVTELNINQITSNVCGRLKYIISHRSDVDRYQFGQYCAALGYIDIYLSETSQPDDILAMQKPDGCFARHSPPEDNCDPIFTTYVLPTLGAILRGKLLAYTMTGPNIQAAHSTLVDGPIYI